MMTPANIKKHIQNAETSIAKVWVPAGMFGLYGASISLAEAIKRGATNFRNSVDPELDSVSGNLFADWPSV